jgi:hypothetical protein
VKNLLRIAVPLLATLSIGCVNGGQQLVTLYGFDYAVELPAATTAEVESEGIRTVCRPVLETTVEATPVVDPFLAD